MISTLSHQIGINTIEAITSQLIQEPTHILSNSCICIDLVFTSQPNLVMKSGVHSSLHENSHHQLVCAKFNLKVWYPPPYEREIWHYQHANIDQIKRAIEHFPREKSFRNLCINEMAHLFNKTIKYILSNYIPYEKITSDNRDQPWINSKIKQLIQEINNIYRIFILSNNNPQIFEKTIYLQNQLKSLTESNKERYYLRISKKLMDPMTIAKTYWSILKSSLNNSKIHCIPPLFHQNKYATDF